MGRARSAAWGAAMVGFGLAVVVTLHEPAVVVAAMAFALGLAALALVGGRRGAVQRPGVVLALVLVNLGLALGSAALVGSVRAQSHQAEAWLRSAPATGVHPMQHVGLVLDGFGPHDLVVPDHVEPQGSRGLSPAQLADKLETQIHRIGRVAYPLEEAAPWAAGRPLAGRTAWVGARVEVEPASAEGGLESFRLRIVSGGRGPGASVRGVCPSSPARRGPFAGPDATQMDRGGDCARRYVFPGDAGLGLRSRWGAEVRDGAWPRPWSGPTVSVPLLVSALVVAWLIGVAGALRVGEDARRGFGGVVAVSSAVISLGYLGGLAARTAGDARRPWSELHSRWVDAVGIFVGVDTAHALSVLQAVAAAVPVLGLLGLSIALVVRTSGSRALRASASTSADSGSKRAPAHIP